MSDGVRVRFAPSPTGHLHVGGARTALYNWLYARKTGGCFVLRIEDTDAARSTAESLQGILAGLRWLGLDWDEGPEKGGPHGPYFQSERRDLYRGEIDRLLAAGRAYPCFCSADQLAAMKAAAAEGGDEFQGYDGRCGRIPPEEAARRVAAGEPHALRFRTPGEGETILYDVVRGKCVFRNDVLEDFVILKGDGLPTYNFAVVVDDHSMAITHVIRGDDHISNTPRHLLLYEALGYALPKFAHLPMILGADKTRLSKRHGATSVDEYARRGILPAGMMNYLALLGWSLDGKTEFFTPKKLAEAFSLKRVGSNPAVFDPEKLSWLSGEHFVRLSEQEKLAGVLCQLAADGVIPAEPDEEERARVASLVKLLGKRLRSFGEADHRVWHFFRDLPEYDAEAVAAHLDGEAANTLAELAGRLEALPDFDVAGIEGAARGLAEEKGLGAGEIIHPLRVAVTGRAVSADVFRTCVLAGRERVLARLRGRAWEDSPGDLATPEGNC